MNDLTAAAAVERLTAQLGEALFGEPGLSLMEIANRRAEIEQMAKDAGRWVYVREQHGVTVSVEEADDDGDKHFCSGHSPEQLDAAIDAAMKEQAE